MYDIMFDPQRTHNDEDETPGGIHEENMQDDAASDRVIGDRTINDTESLDGFSGTGKLTKLLSVVGRILKAVTGKGSWFSSRYKHKRFKHTHGNGRNKYCYCHKRIE